MEDGSADVSDVMAMVDDNAHCRCDLGVIECCIRMTYPPAGIATEGGVGRHADDGLVPLSPSSSVLFALPDADAAGAVLVGFGRVADENKASHGLMEGAEGLGLLMLTFMHGHDICLWQTDCFILCL